MSVSRTTLVLVGLGVLLAGCGGASGLKEPLAEFSASSTKAIEATSPLLRDINADARRYAYLQASLDPELALVDSSECSALPPQTPAPEPAQILAGDEDPQLINCFLTARFNQRQIDIILGALAAMKGYTEVLGKLASDETVQEGRAQAKALGSELGTLATSLGAESATGSAIASLATTLGELAIEHERTEALHATIREGDGHLRRIIALVTPPAAQVSRVRASYLTATVVRLTDAYGDRTEQARTGARAFPEEERLALLARVEAAVTARTAPEASPAKLLAAMQKAHDALLQAVLEGPDASPEAFRAAVIEFSRYVEAFAAAVTASNTPET